MVRTLQALNVQHAAFHVVLLQARYLLAAQAETEGEEANRPISNRLFLGFSQHGQHLIHIEVFRGCHWCLSLKDIISHCLTRVKYFLCTSEYSGFRSCKSSTFSAL